MTEEPQTTRNLLLVRPVRFSGNSQTAASNRFQNLETAVFPQVQAHALDEFHLLQKALEQAGMRVFVFDDTPEPHTPDSLFPNNWVSFHADGTAVLYPMLAPNRRAERRPEILDALEAAHGFAIRRVIDLTAHEAKGRFLEGTGSLVLDRAHRVAYACLSLRTDPVVLDEFARALGYEAVGFVARDSSGVPIYHTNVMMCVGRRFAAICIDSIDPAMRNAVVDRLLATGRILIDLSFAQMSSFAGNMLEIGDVESGWRVVLSRSALESLQPRQVEQFDSIGLERIAIPVPTIERFGGGSVRCMITEIHLPFSSIPARRSK